MIDDAITRLKEILATVDRDLTLKELISARDDVLSRFGAMFSLEALPNLTATDFQSFLLFKNNHHWTGLHRQGPQICKNMEALRRALQELHNTAHPIEDRFDSALQGVSHLGKGILSAVLHVMYPNDYGVWNRTSEGGLKILSVWPEFDYGASPGKRYNAINEILHQLRDGLSIDLWTLDALLWRIVGPINSDIAPENDSDIELGPDEPGDLQKFGLEKYLHEFLRDNWDATELGKNWGIYVEAGDDAGYKYQCGSIGQIDILARHKNGRDWLVVELKRDKSGDATVGQLLRYIGFVKHNLAKETDRVFGLIVARSLDEKLHYAVSGQPNIAVHTYAVDFKLGSPVKGNQRLPFKLLTLDDLARAT